MSRGQRRLAAIMFTDMSGYTSLSERNESLALDLLEEHRRRLRPFFPKHGGREIKTMGDAFLVEFKSALEAVRCAYEIQQSLHELNSNRPAERKFSLRIGINLGDVVERQSDVYGDAVNIASRIEPMAPPGGICLTEQVYAQIKNKFEFPLLSLGKRKLKNVSEAVEVYTVGLPWDQHNGPGNTFDKNRVAILPFSSLSPDPNDEFFADGLTEELVSRVSQVRELQVIARTSVMTYKGTGKKIGEIAGELRVGSLVEGSVRKSGNKIRVTAQLIDAATEAHVWSSNYDKSLDDIFAVQSDIAEQLTDALRIKLLPEEKGALERRATESTVAYTMYLKGRYYWNERNPTSIKHAMEYFERAIEMDRSFALAYVGLADCYLVLADQGVLAPKEILQKAKPLLDTALEHGDGLAETHASLGNYFLQGWNWSQAEAEFNRAIKLNPNYATSHHWYSLLLSATGHSQRALNEIMTALSLDPLSPIVNLNVGITLIEAGRFDEGVEKMRFVLVLEPGFDLARAHIGSAYVSIAKYDEGIRELLLIKESMASNPWWNGLLGYAYGLKGDMTNAQIALKRLEGQSKTGFVPSAILGSLYFVLGEKEKALSLMQRAFEEHSTALVYFRRYPIYRGLRADPRFKPIFDRMVSAGPN